MYILYCTFLYCSVLYCTNILLFCTFLLSTYFSLIITIFVSTTYIIHQLISTPHYSLYFFYTSHFIPSQDFDLDAVIASTSSVYHSRTKTVQVPKPSSEHSAKSSLGTLVETGGGAGGGGSAGGDESWAVTTYLSDEQYEILRYITRIYCFQYCCQRASYPILCLYLYLY